MLQKKVCICCKTLSHCERIQKQQQQKITKKKNAFENQTRRAPYFIAQGDRRKSIKAI